MQYVIGFIFLIVLGMSGGISSSSDYSDRSGSSQTASVARFTESTQVETESLSESTSINNARVQEVSREVEYVDLRIPEVLTISAEDIEYSSAVLRGEVNMRSHESGLVFFVYGYNKNSVINVGLNYDSYEDIPEFNDDKVRTKVVDNRPKKNEEYSYRFNNLVQDTEYYYQMCVQHDTGVSDVNCGEVKSFKTNLRDVRSDRLVVPRVSLDSVVSITAYTAEIEGDVIMNDGKSGIAFFVYGEDSELVNLVEDDYETYSDVREFDEFLQKVRVATRLLGRSTHSRVLDDLELGTKYYYSLCVEYDGDQNGIECSSTRSFTTDKRDKDDLPNVSAGQSLVTQTIVRLSGEVNMRDFNDGLVFFVYGTNEGKVFEVEKETEFGRVRQSSDLLQKRVVDNDHDGNDRFVLYISDLLEDTTYSYRLCVEFEDEDDNGRDDLFLSCGGVNNFETRSN